MPPHRVYIEPFLGSGAVLRNKRPAERNIGIDRSQDAIRMCLDLCDNQSDVNLLEDDALELLPSLSSMMGDSIFLDQPDVLIYADPPYVAGTQKSGSIYDFEMTDADHERRLGMLINARCRVMISGYRSRIYDDALSLFHRVDYMTQTRRGMVEESLWMNFKPPVALHDYSHLGSNYRDRERIKRNKARWAKKIAAMDRQERLAVMEVLTANI